MLVRVLAAALCLTATASADDAVDFISDAKLFYRVVACGGSDPLPATMDAKTVDAHCAEMTKRYAYFSEKYITPAQAFFAEPESTQQDTVDRASAALRRFGMQFRRIGGVMAVVTTLDEAQQLEPALDDTVTLCGIGVAQGTRPDTGPNAIAVVIVLGWER